METSIITLAGYLLAIIFAAASAIFANSLRHRTRQLTAIELLNSDLNVEAMGQAEKVTAAYQAEIEVRLELSKANRRVTTAEQALGLAKGELVRLEKGNETTARVFSSVQDERDLLKARLANSYERLGKRFQKIGKV